MKVILLTDVKGRGTEGDVIEVARGFAVNYLLPRKMATEATPGNIKQLDARMHNIRKRETERHAEAGRVAVTLDGKHVVIEARAGDTGKLFGSITPGAVAAALAAQLGVDVDRRKLGVHGHVKTLGDYPVTIHLYQDVSAEVLVSIVREGGTAAALETVVAAPAAEEVVEEAFSDVVEVEETVEIDEPEADAEDESATE